MNLRRPAALAAVVALLLPTLLQAAETGSPGFSGSGFFTLAAGKILHGGPSGDFNGYAAPVFVTDYAQAGIYQNNGWSINPDSRLGLQGTATINPRLSLTGQIVSRGANDGRINLEWAYANFRINDSLTLQIGRKRLPLFYYSESQDVGFAYPWVHLPSGQYGWEIVNYNGTNLLYHGQWRNWSGSMNLFAGNETRNDNGFWTIYNGRNTRTDSKWSNILGADFNLNRDWFEARAAYIQSDIQNRFEDPSSPPPHAYTPRAGQKIYSLSFSIDHRNWVAHNEYLYMDRKPTGEEDFSFLLGVGYRMGKALPMLTYNRYRMRLTPEHASPAIVDPSTIDPLSAEGWSILALSLRYELTPTSAVKVQLDQWKDLNGPAFNGGTPYGNPRLFSVSYDTVF